MKQLESLRAWMVSRALATEAYRLTLLPPVRHHFGLVEQIRRAALSVPANIVEGYCLGTKPQLVRHLRIAFASAAELRLHLEVAAELGLISAPHATRVRTRCSEAIALLIGLLKRLGAGVPG